MIYLIIHLKCMGDGRLDAAVLDLVADDSTGIQKQKAKIHWDKVD